MEMGGQCTGAPCVKGKLYKTRVPRGKKKIVETY